MKSLCNLVSITAEACTRKLVMEICNAKNFVPKDSQDTTSVYAIVDYDGQRRRTKTKFKDLNLQWDKKMEFLVHNKASMAGELLEISLYNDKQNNASDSDLGTLRLLGMARPKLITVVEQDLSHSGSFLGQFVEALHYYSALFDALGDGLDLQSPERRRGAATVRIQIMSLPSVLRLKTKNCSRPAGLVCWTKPEIKRMSLFKEGHFGQIKL